MTKYCAQVGVLAAALFVGGLMTVATSAEPKSECPSGSAIFRALVLNFVSGDEIPKSEGRLCRTTIRSTGSLDLELGPPSSQPVRVDATLEVETGSQTPTTWAIFLGDRATSQEFFLGNVTTGPGQSAIEFEQTICMGPCFNTSFRAPYLAAVSNGSTTFITGFDLP